MVCGRDDGEGVRAMTCPPVRRPPGMPTEPAAWTRGRAVAATLRLLSRTAWFVESEVTALIQVVRPGAVCLDVGAQFGLYSHVLAELVGPRGAVVAVEPQPLPAALLRAGLWAAGQQHVRVRQVALADTAGSAAMQVPLRAGLPVHGRSFVRFAGPHDADPNREFGGATHLEVALRTLDGLLATEGLDRLDFLKVDVEGAELRVLRGAEATVQRHRPVVQLEIERRFTRRYGTTPEAVWRWLRERGYRLCRFRRGRWRPAARLDLRRRNNLFVPAEHPLAG